jgi:hypothetical protein
LYDVFHARTSLIVGVTAMQQCGCAMHLPSINVTMTLRIGLGRKRQSFGLERIDLEIPATTKSGRLFEPKGCPGDSRLGNSVPSLLFLT